MIIDWLGKIGISLISVSNHSFKGNKDITTAEAWECSGLNWNLEN